MSNRQAGSNNLNEHSTRSHAILTLYAESEVPDDALETESGTVECVENFQNGGFWQSVFS